MDRKEKLMNNHNILLKILEIIGYSENKEAFVDEFLKNVQMQSVIDLIQSLPQDKQSEIKDQFSKIQNDQNKASDLLKSYFTEEQIQEALKNSSKTAMEEYIKAINPTLSSTQKNNLITFSQQLNPSA